MFLLSKTARYFYDAAAVAEPSALGNGASGYHAQRRLSDGHQRERPDGANRVDYGGLAEQRGIIAKKREYMGKHVTSDPQADQPFGYTRNARSVWRIPTQPTPDAHFATFPEALAERCILAGSAQGDLVLDPFFGSGTVGKVAERLGRRWLGIDLAYADISKRKTAQRGLFMEARHG